MSLLIVNHSPESVLLLTDTLATTEAGDPSHLVSKCSIVPHLEMVIAFTGVAGIGNRWAEVAQHEMLCRDIEMLDLHAPQGLRRVRDELSAQFGPAPTSSTVYHFGFSASADAYVGYAYRSTDDFASESLGCGLRVKPQPAGDFDPPDSLNEMIALAEKIRDEQTKVSLAERVWIGGELILTVLVNRTTSCSKVHTSLGSTMCGLR